VKSMRFFILVFILKLVLNPLEAGWFEKRERD